ncbi:hypothetical protein CBM2623_A100068 [Cupriavidus taiwanensis]|nr:hypothetical protein CBM2623_A100068 [Cupriavidus taiwanensis]
MTHGELWALSLVTGKFRFAHGTIYAKLNYKI